VPHVGSTSPSGKVVQYGVIGDLEVVLKVDGDKIAAFMIEPIQGAAGSSPFPFYTKS
jgi:ornithine--oxo-acid transaminase